MKIIHFIKVQFLFCAIFLLYTPTSFGSDESVLLRLKPKLGQTYHLYMDAQQQVLQTVQGSVMNIIQQIGLGYKFTVTFVSKDGTTENNVTYTSTKFNQIGATGKIEYDSKNPPAKIPAQAKGFAALVGKKFSVKMTSSGKVIEVKGIKKMINAIISSLKLRTVEKKMMSKFLENRFGKKAIQELVDSMMAFYPEKAVKVGDIWKKEVSKTKGFPIKLENQWILQKRNQGIAEIGVLSKVVPLTSVKPMQVGFVQLKYEVTGTQKGVMELSESTGWITSAVIVQNLAGKVTLKQAFTKKVTSWPISMTSVIKYSQIK
ncbi:MAG: hypothetical protein ACI86H_000135 [bacterium]|jgi:hypothetical protein